MIPRRFLEAVVAQMPSAIAVVEAPSGKTIIANDRSAEIWRRRAIPAARDVSEYGEYKGFAADGTPLRAQDWPLARSLLNGEVVQGEEIEIERGDGTRGFIRVHSAPVLDDDGKAIAAVVVFDDVTDRRSLLATVQQQENELRLVMDALPVLVSFIDKDLEYKLVNRAYEEWFGKGRADIVGKGMAEVLGDAAMVKLRPYVERALAGELVAYEAMVPYATGGTRTIRSKYVPRRTAKGDVEGFVAFVDDVTERKRAEESVRLISEASRLLSSSLDVRESLKNLAGGLVPRLADWCGIDVVAEHGSSEQLAVAHKDPEKVALARELRRQYPINPGATSGLAKVLRFGTHELIAEIPDALLESVAADERHLEMLRQIGFSSMLIVPIRARDAVLGAITLVHAESGRRFVESDLALVEEIAARAALAIENARLYEAERVARREMEAANRRLHVLSEATRTFAKASRDLETLLPLVATTLLEVLGDTATVNLVAEDGETIEQVAIASRVPGLEQEARRAVGERPLKVGHGILGRVIAYGEPMLVPVVDRPALRETIHPSYLEIFDKQSATSFMVAPIHAHERVVGCISVLRGGAPREQGAPAAAYDARDLELLVELTDRAAVALENADLYARSRKAVLLRDEFLSVASHELKTPLTTLTLQVTSLLRAARGGDHATVSVEQVKKIDRQLDRMNDLVTRLLDVARIAGGRLQLELEDANIAALAQEVAGRFHEEAARQGCTLTVDVRGAAEETTARCDPGRVDQVLTNLVVNALKFGRGKPVVITVHAGAQDVRVAVRDEGMGIAHEDQARIFERFERASSARNYGGMGLGLWISREILGAHGGSIRVTSALEQGAEFEAVLPRRGPGSPAAGPA